MVSDGEKAFPNGERVGGPNMGLCGTCVHRVEVKNTRGSVFSLCGRSRSDPAYLRYPRLPVVECEGYERVLAGDGTEGAEDANRRAGRG